MVRKKLKEKKMLSKLYTNLSTRKRAIIGVILRIPHMTKNDENLALSRAKRKIKLSIKNVQKIFWKIEDIL